MCVQQQVAQEGHGLGGRVCVVCVRGGGGGGGGVNRDHEAVIMLLLEVRQK